MVFVNDLQRDRRNRQTNKDQTEKLTHTSKLSASQGPPCQECPAGMPAQECHAKNAILKMPHSHVHMLRTEEAEDATQYLRRMPKSVGLPMLTLVASNNLQVLAISKSFPYALSSLTSTEIFHVNFQILNMTRSYLKTFKKHNAIINSYTFILLSM